MVSAFCALRNISLCHVDKWLFYTDFWRPCVTFLSWIYKPSGIDFCVPCEVRVKFHFLFLWISNQVNTIYWKECSFLSVLQGQFIKNSYVFMLIGLYNMTVKWWQYRYAQMSLFIDLTLFWSIFPPVSQFFKMVYSLIESVDIPVHLVVFL